MTWEGGFGGDCIRRGEENGDELAGSARGGGSQVWGTSADPISFPTCDAVRKTAPPFFPASSISLSHVRYLIDKRFLANLYLGHSTLKGIQIL